jgi:hypothetical protein
MTRVSSHSIRRAGNLLPAYMSGRALEPNYCWLSRMVLLALAIEASSCF